VRTPLRIAKHARSSEREPLESPFRRLPQRRETLPAAQFAWNHVACDLGTAEQNAFAANLVGERLDDGLGDVLSGCDGDLQSLALDGRAVADDSGNLQPGKRAPGILSCAMRSKTARTPFTLVKITTVFARQLERLVQGLERARRTNLNNGISQTSAPSSRRLADSAPACSRARDTRMRQPPTAYWTDVFVLVHSFVLVLKSARCAAGHIFR